MHVEWVEIIYEKGKEMTLWFIALQFVLLLFMIFHDWIPVPPFNDISALKLSDSTLYRVIGSAINGITVLIPLIITIAYYQQPFMPLSATITLVAFYTLLTIGTIFSWWTPYLFGSSPKHKQAFNKFNNTHYFLPKRGDNVIPNTLHIVLHLQIWTCLIISIYLLIAN